MAHVHRYGIRRLPKAKERDAEEGAAGQGEAIHQSANGIDIRGWNRVSDNEIAFPDPLAQALRVRLLKVFLRNQPLYGVLSVWLVEPWRMTGRDTSAPGSYEPARNCRLQGGCKNATQ